MRGQDRQQSSMFSYLSPLSPEQRGPINHPVRAICGMADQGFDNISSGSI
jgi:hypothetical protein